MGAVDGALLQIGIIAALVNGHLVLRQIQFDDPGGAAGQKFAVVGDHDDRGAQRGDELLQPRQPIEIQVIGRFIEQHHVKAGKQQACQRHPCGLPAGKRTHQRLRIQGEAQLRQRLGQPVLQIHGPTGHPVVERLRVGIIGPGIPRTQRLRGALHRFGGRRAAGAPGDVAGDAFALDPLVLLGHRADKRRVRRGGHAAALRLIRPGQQPQQRTLARPVGSHHTVDIARGGGKVQISEEGTVGMSAAKILGDKSCSHAHNFRP